MTYLYDLSKSVQAPVSKGQRMGKIIVLLEDETLFISEISAAENIEELTFWRSFGLVLRSFFSF